MGRERGSIAEITLGLELGVDPDDHLVEPGNRYDVRIRSWRCSMKMNSRPMTLRLHDAAESLG